MKWYHVAGAAALAFWLGSRRTRSALTGSGRYVILEAQGSEAPDNSDLGPS